MGNVNMMLRETAVGRVNKLGTVCVFPSGCLWDGFKRKLWTYSNFPKVVWLT